MKISAWHKERGDHVEWYEPLFSGHMDKVYMSKVFSFTPDYAYPIDADEIEKGLLNEESPKIIKLPIDELLGDTIIAFLDALDLSNYILEKDIEGEFLTLQIDEKRCLNEYQKQDAFATY